MLNYLDGTIRMELRFVRGPYRLPATARTPWMQFGHHALTWLTDGGRMDTWFEGAGPNPLVRRPGGIFYLAANRRRQVEIVGEAGVELMAVGLWYGILGNLDLLSFFDIPFQFDSKTEGSLKSAVNKLLASELDDTRHPLLRLVERKRLCSEILRLLVATAKTRPDTKERILYYRAVAPAVEKMKRNFRDALMISELARCCHLSRSQFHHNFKRTMGLPPLEYQRWLRLEEAKRLMMRGGMNMAEVAEAAGWQDPLYFSRIFKRVTGYAPSAFRKLCREGVDLR